MTEQCPQCGRALAAGEAEGLCARCLLALALREPAGGAETAVLPRGPDRLPPDRSGDRGDE